MNEAKIESTPAEEEAMLFDFNDLKDNDTTEDTVELPDDEVSKPTETETGEKETDYTPFLNELSNKIKFNHEPVKVESVEDIINNFQKGLNYDKLNEKLEELSTSEEMTYLKEKAEENGLSTKEFIKLVKEQEEKSKQEEYNTKYNELIDSGVSEELVKDMLNEIKEARELKAEVNKIKQKEAKEQETKQQNAKYESFAKEFPNVKLEDLPKEVVTSNDIVGAYTRHLLAETTKELELLKQNQDVVKRNPVKETTEHGGVVTEQEDDFLKGLFGKK